MRPGSAGSAESLTRRRFNLSASTFDNQARSLGAFTVIRVAYDHVS